MTATAAGTETTPGGIEAGKAQAPHSGSGDVELSVVIPCLNEAKTLGACIAAARGAFSANGIVGEVVVADNGSSDGSREIAAAAGARVIAVDERGYGSALMGGIAAARGRFVLMGDADQSYDFGEAPRFLAKLREGFDLVQGCRLERGGGTVRPGAMRPLHRWWGNPMFSWLARSWFGAPIHDVQCGLRGFSAEWFARAGLRCTGMEFASEMVIKAALGGAHIAEVPITLYPDGRQGQASHLRTFRDGWRNLRFYLIYSPRWLFLAPGIFLAAAGVLGYAVAMPRLRVGHVTFDVHTLLFASLAVICGYQSILFGVFTKIFAIGEGLLPLDRGLERLFTRVTLEKGLVLGLATMVGGLVLLGGAVAQWRALHFGDLDYDRTMRWVIPGVTLTALGFQTILSSFFLSILGLRRR
jgi:glycosyltransferase involved in cell wall biosynthesis